MGGDFAPEQTVLGAYDAVAKFNDSEIVLDRQFVMFMRECVKG